MKRKLIELGAAALVFFGLGFYAGNKNKAVHLDGPANISNEGSVLVIGQEDKPVLRIYQPDPRSTVISTDQKGNVKIKVKHVGYGFQPGIGFGYSDRLRLTLDARLLYWDRFGLNGLLALSPDHNATAVQPFFVLTYALPFEYLSNTSLFAGTWFDKTFIGGVRVKF